MKGHAIAKAPGASEDEPEHWTTYDNAKKVEDLMAALVKPIPHDIELEDNVITLDQIPAESMKIDTTGEHGVRFYALDPSKTNGMDKADII